MDNRCVGCGEIVPEGRQVCPNCESGVTFATDNNVGGKWIPVTERLPDMEVEVLTCTQDGYIEISHWTFMNSGKVEWRDGNWRTSEGITHWMPLPEPPKET